jgi:DNA-directed RNA polymerase specialized sigma24 family protein
VASPPDNDALFGALTSLKAGRDPQQAWAIIDRWTKARFPQPKDQDARQLALISIHRNVAQAEASSPQSCAKWVRTIVERKKIDRARSERSRAAVSLVNAQGETLEVEGDAGASISEDVLTNLLEQIEASVDDALEARYERPIERVVPRHHARARLLRTMGHDLPAIREALGVEVTDAALSKWVERGLPILIDAIERWKGGDEDREAVATRLLEKVQARRGDAGKARLERRKSAKHGGPSVGKPGRRPKLRRPCSMPSRFTRGPLATRGGTDAIPQRAMGPRSSRMARARPNGVLSRRRRRGG